VSPEARDVLMREATGLGETVGDLIRTAEDHESRAAALRAEAARQQGVISTLLDDLNGGPDRGVE
jgi:hypothetical protein